MLTVTLRTSILGLLTLLPLIVMAQDEETVELPRWYQIEILIFGQNNVNTEEVFRDQPFELESNSILSTATAINPLLNKQPNGSAIIIKETDAELDEVAEASLQQEVTSLEVEQTSTVESEAAIEVAIPEFIVSDPEALILAEHNEKLRRRRAYRVLWHGSWQQALEENSLVKEYSLSAGRLLLQPQNNAEPSIETNTETDTEISPEIDPLDALVEQLADTAVELNNADIETTFGDELNAEPITASMLAAERLAEAQALVAEAPKSFRELQGSFKIYKTRFAHIELDLWFTQLNEAVPGVSLPLLTIHQPPEIAAEEPEAQEADLVANNIATEIDNVSAADFLDDSSNQAVADIDQQVAIPSFELTYELAYEPVVYGHIEEDRRVRPEELYYVDHPLFGVIIKMVEVDHPLLRTAPEEIDPLAF